MTNRMTNRSQPQAPSTQTDDEGTGSLATSPDPFAPQAAEQAAPPDATPPSLAIDEVPATVTGTAAMLTSVLDVSLYGGYLAAPLSHDERKQLEEAMRPVLEKRGIEIEAAPELNLGLTVIGLAVPRYHAKRARELAEQEVKHDLSGARKEGERQVSTPAQNPVVELPRRGAASDLVS